MTIHTIRHEGDLPDPIDTLEHSLMEGNLTIAQAVAENSFFIDPEAVRGNSPLYPSHARKSNEHYGIGRKGEAAEWLGQAVTLDDNSRAQAAWKRYSGGLLSRGRGWGVRHIWGNPWDPSAFTAGWNLVYMPFWIGMLTEEQHPHPLVRKVIQQASWDLYFRDNPVCEAPSFVVDPGESLEVMLGEHPLRIVGGALPPRSPRTVAPFVAEGSTAEMVIALRKRTGSSWTNLIKAAAALADEPYEPFGTDHVAASSKSNVRPILRETGIELAELAELFRAFGDADPHVRKVAPFVAAGDPTAIVAALRSRTNSSWSNLAKAAAALEGRAHEPFGTLNVEASAKSVVRRMQRESGLELPELAALIHQLSAR